jgi:hypothetical protein
MIDYVILIHLNLLSTVSGSVTSKKNLLVALIGSPVNIDLELLETTFVNYSYHPHGISFKVRFDLYFEIYNIILVSRELITNIFI